VVQLASRSNSENFGFFVGTENLGFYPSVDVPPGSTLLAARQRLVQRQFVCLELVGCEKDLVE